MRCINLSLTGNLFSQNLLDTSTWTIGNGSVTGFNIIGSNDENIRELGVNHDGDQTILWKVEPDFISSLDGGWNSDYVSINNTKTYRLSVWIMKTNSDSGATSFGTNSITNGNQNLIQLNGNAQPYPYFWNGDLPQLNRWYLLVGFVHNRFHSSTISEGKIYDGITGQAVESITDFKFNSNATTLMHRSYLLSTTDPYDRQYFWEPRIDLVDGFEPPVDALLNISQNPKLLFTYDNAGNQKQRFYCSVPGCSIPNAPAGRSAEENIETKDPIVELEELDEIKVTLSPNPTKGIISIKLNSDSKISISNNINVYNSSGTLVSSVPSQLKDELEIDLTNLSTGIYFVHIHLSNGTSVTKQIIKN